MQVQRTTQRGRMSFSKGEKLRGTPYETVPSHFVVRAQQAHSIEVREAFIEGE